MNTPDTEWQEDFFEYFKGNIDGESKLHCNTKYVREFIQQLLSSRDTYWKERVEETRTKLLFVGEKVLKEMSEIYAVDIKYADKKQWLEPSEFERIFLHRFNEAGLKALDQLLDNLK